MVHGVRDMVEQKKIKICTKIKWQNALGTAKEFGLDLNPNNFNNSDIY